MSQQEILVVEDDLLLSQLLAEALEKMGYSASSAANLADAQHYLIGHEPSLVIIDGRLPDGDGISLLSQLADTCPAIILTAYASVKHAVSAMKAGAAEYLAKPINLDELEIAVQRVLETAALRRDYQFCKNQLNRRNKQNRLMVGNSKALEEVHKLIKAVAPSDMNVLIQGESGTGKELVASELHRHSQRHQRNFVALDCCTLQEKLFESELFGHEKGAFTGADRQKKGLIENAEGGTLFLDEIGEIEGSIQAKLLRVLEYGQFRRLGGIKDLTADVRIVAATNRDLAKMSQEGKFREDLYYRLSAFLITLPPLRERRDDIPALMDNFVENHSFSRRINKFFSNAALKALVAYDWPGNIRELKNVVERAIILSSEQREICLEHLSFCAMGRKSAHTLQLSYDHEPTLEEIEKSYLETLLKKHSGHRAKISKILGISERNTYRLLKKYALS